MAMNDVHGDDGRQSTIGDHNGQTNSADAPPGMAHEVSFPGLTRGVAAARSARVRQLRHVRGIVRSISNQSAQGA
ncbi:MAG TPA: hypothetical protein VMP10_04670 [Chloroflexota bacterium]|nr:hypothetical protein [Chloroflexota bacterium]